MNIADYFERRTRDNGEAFYTLTDDRPDWLYDAVMEAHDGEFPNDWRYGICHSIALAIDEGDDDAIGIAESLIDVYVRDLLQWLVADTSRLAYCVSAAEIDGIEETIRFGQFVAIEQMAQIMIDAVNENGEES